MTEVLIDPMLETALVAIDDFYARLFRDWPEAITRRVGDCTVNYSGNPRLNGANHLFPHRPDALTEDVLDQAEAFFSEHNAYWTAIYTDRYMPEADALLAERDYSARWHSTLMVLDGSPSASVLRQMPRLYAPAVRATTRDHLDDIVAVLRDAFGTSHVISRRVVRAEHLGDPTVRHYLMFDRDDPGVAVACATATIHAGGVATIWNVGTRRDYRREGYGTALMLGVLDDLRQQGAPLTALLSSAEGVGLYTALGYRTLAKTYYMGPPPVVTAWFD